jgi:hypothetical protein
MRLFCRLGTIPAPAELLPGVVLGFRIKTLHSLHSAKFMKRSVLVLSFWLLFCGMSASALAEQSLVALPVAESPLLDGIADDPAWQNAPAITTLDKTSGLPVRIKAVYTESEIFFLVVFADSDESRTHKSWVWDKGRQFYTVGNDREDIFVFKWNMEPKPVDLSIQSDSPYKADIWYWKACRTDKAGYADDKTHVYGRTKDRNATAVVARTGEMMYLLREGDRGESAYKVDLISQYQGAILPRYTTQQPTGSRGDIRARGVWHNGSWSIELGRKLVTHNGDDIQFVPGRKYLFGISLYEIAGREPNANLSDPLYGTGDVNEALWLEFRP